MKVKYIFVTVVVNIFVMMFVTLFQEFADIRDTYGTIGQTFDKSLESAVVLTTASEEFFSDEYINGMSSRSDVFPRTRIMRNGQWIETNLYVLTMFAEPSPVGKGRFPNSQSEYNQYEATVDITDIYEFLFGTDGSDAKNAELTWANFYQDPTVAYAFDPSARIPNAEFEAFYDNVGKEITSELFVRERQADSWITSEKELPVLAQMGLRLHDVNETTSSITADNFVSVDHYGKQSDDTAVVLSGVEDTKYYLTPYSLGVTYVPTKVLKTAMRVNLENSLRLSKCKKSPTSSNFVDYDTIYASAEGCIDTSVYVDDGSGNTNINPETHNPVAGTTWGMFNDGRVEYDMDSLQVKVDYYVVDFYDDTNWKIVNEIEGATPYREDLLKTLPTRLQAVDTSQGALSGKRIVAAVTSKVRVEVPYSSPILQWFVENTSVNAHEHYGIGNWNSTTGSMDTGDEGNWYTYTTFISISR